jgi:amidohydrolase
MIGHGGKVLLLRADMDALPMAEESGEDFACTTGNAHACGHDFHAAMLLAAAKMLKEQEESLKGTVKLMFQPAEEIFKGSRNMIDAGILQNPPVDAALACHVSTGRMPVGLFLYNDKSTMMNSVDGFEIKIQGRGSHGAYPQNSVDPINIGVHLHMALQSLIARECEPSRSCVLTIGEFKSGNAANIIPDSALLSGTIRTNDAAQREHLVKRLKEVSQATAELFGGSAEVTMLYEVPTLNCDPELTREMVSYMKELTVPNQMGYPDVTASASDDFALIAEQVPAVYLYLSAGFLDERGDYPAHNPKVRFNEEVCPVGAAALAHCAVKWLANHC